MKADTEKRTKQKKQKRLTQRMQAKLGLVFCIVVGVLFVLAIRLGYLTGTDKYKKGALDLRSYVSSEIPSQRGTIFDRNGQILATSELRYTLIFDPFVVNTQASFADPTIQALSEVYELDANELKNILVEKKDSKYVILKRDLSYDDKVKYDDYLKTLDDNQKKLVKGIWFEQDYKRFYPFNELASHVIGFTDSDNMGVYGIESYYNDELTGTNGKTYGYYDSELNIVETKNEAKDGNNIVSTIDINVQRVVEKTIENFLSEYGAENAACIVMDAYSGEVLAMQSNFSYNLNSPRDLTAFFTEEEIKKMSDEEKVNNYYRIWNNYCVTSAFEPGSTYKPFTVAAALEEDIANGTEKFVCDGKEKFHGNVTIKCSNKYGHGELDMAGAIALSCNDCLMQIAARMGRDVFYRYLQNFGFSTKTGIDLPGEAVGQIFTKEQLNETELATSSFGQGFTTTMIQMAASFCSLVNGGSYYKPHVVKALRNSDGATVKKYDAVESYRTLSYNTGEYIKESLYQTVTDGTGKNAQIKGYKIGGKTGTSQKLPREDEKYVVSFEGFVENDDKCIVFYVVVDECHNEEMGSKSKTAMDLFVDIASSSLPFLGFYPEGEIDYKIDIAPEVKGYNPEKDEADPAVLSEEKKEQ